MSKKSDFGYFTFFAAPAIAAVLIGAFYICLGHRFITQMYLGRSWGIFNHIIEARQTNPLAHYIQKADISFLFLICVFFSGTVVFVMAFLEKVKPAIVFMSSVGVLLVLVSTSKYGPGITSDSLFYATAAENLVRGKGFVIFNGEIFALWPPLYPFLLSFACRMGIDPIVAAQIINAFVFGLIIFFSSKLLQKNIDDKTLVLSGTFATLFSSPLLSASVYAHSETIFTLLIVLFTLALIRFLEKPGMTTLFFTASYAALAGLQRYAGLPIIGAGVICIVVCLKTRPIFRKIFYALIFLAISLTPLLIWLARNYFLTSTLTGGRAQAPIFEISRAIDHGLNTLSLWFLPDAIPFALRATVFLSVAAALITTNILFFRRLKNAQKDYCRVLLSVGCVTVCYMVFLIVYSAKETNYNITDRLLAPIYPLIIFLFFCGIKNTFTFFESFPRDFRRVALLLNLVILMFLSYSVIRVTERVSAFLLTGAGEFNSSFYHESKIIQWIKTTPLDGKLYSDLPEAVYYLTKKFSYKLPKRDHCPSAYFQGDDLELLQRSLDLDGPSYFAWINVDRQCFYSPEELKSLLGLEKLKDFSFDGIYVFSPGDCCKSREFRAASGSPRRNVFYFSARNSNYATAPPGKNE